MTPHPLVANLVKLSNCVCQTLAVQSEPVCWCGLYPGALPAWDYCGGCASTTCGMSYISLIGAYPFGGLGVPENNAECGSGLGAIIQVGVLRCLPSGGDDGEPPGVEEMSETSILLFNDMMAVRDAALCCFEDDVQLREYTAAAPQGGCSGGQWTMHIELR